VLPPRLLFGDPDTRYWISLALTDSSAPDAARYNNGWFSLGRLKPGATIEQVRDQLKVLDAVNIQRAPAHLKPLLDSTGSTPASSRSRTISCATCRVRSICCGRRHRRAHRRRWQSRQHRTGQIRTRLADLGHGSLSAPVAPISCVSCSSRD
jgi:hypothetical protein